MDQAYKIFEIFCFCFCSEHLLSENMTTKSKLIRSRPLLLNSRQSDSLQLVRRVDIYTAQVCPAASGTTGESEAGGEGEYRPHQPQLHTAHLHSCSRGRQPDQWQGSAPAADQWEGGSGGTRYSASCCLPVSRPSHNTQPCQPACRQLKWEKWELEVLSP